MSAPRRRIFKAAMLGFAITAAFVSYQMLSASQSVVLMLLFIWLCPPSVLSIPVIDAEIGTSSFYFLWTVIAVLNAGFYVIIRILLDWLRRPHQSS